MEAIMRATPLLMLMLNSKSWALLNDSPCSLNCSEPVILEPPTLTPLEITSGNVIARLTVAPETIQGKVVKTTMWRSYCKFCLLCDPTENCHTQENVINPRESSIESILKSNKCPVGSTCSPSSSDCLGGGLIHCNAEPIIDRWIPEKKFQYRGMFKNSAVGDACVQDWECQINNLDFPINLRGDQDRGVWIYTYSAIGETIELSSSKPTLFTSIDGKSYVIPPVPLKHHSKSNLYCMTKPPRTLCYLQPGDGVELAKIFRIDNSRYGWSQNVLIFAPSLSSLETPKNLDIGGTEINVNQLGLVIDELHYEQLQSQLNIFNLAQDLFDTQKLLYTVLKSLTKTNPPLLPDIIGIPGTTVWKTTQHPSICPCESSPKDGSICSSKFSWVNGVPKWREANDFCPPHSNETLTNGNHLKMFQNYSMDSRLLPVLKFRESVRAYVESQNPSVEQGPSNFSNLGSNNWIYDTIMNWWVSIRGILVSLGTVWSWLMFLSYFFTCLKPNSAS